MSGRLAFMPKSVLGRLTVFFRSRSSDCMGTYYYRIGGVGGSFCKLDAGFKRKDWPSIRLVLILFPLTLTQSETFANSR